MLHTLSTMPSAIKGSYLSFADLGNNGKVLDSCLKNLLYTQEGLETGEASSERYAHADHLAESAPHGSGGVLFLPWFNGSISPGQDEYLRGGFLNLSHNTKRAHLMRAVFEGLAMNWRWLRGPA
jgi:xylulokinase